MKTLLCLLLVACNTQNGSTPPQVGKPVTLPPVEVVTDKVEKPSLSVGITIKGTADQIARMTRIIAEVDEIVASKEFGDAVLAHTYLGKPGFASTDKTPAQVLQDARSALQSARMRRISIEFKRHRSANVTAWVYPGGDTIYMNSTRLGRDDKSVAATLHHEMMHLVGYGHDRKPTSRRPYSVPYSTGKMVGGIYAARRVR